MGKKSLFLFLLCLLLSVVGGTSFAADVNESCVACHQGAATDWERGVKASFMQCTDCHGSDHTGPATGAIGIPTPNTCAECHSEEVKEFNKGKHYYAWEAMLAVPTYQNMPEVVTDKGCVVCHQIGYVWEDGSQGRCDSCHTKHVFSAEEARKPEACGTCHTGDHPQYEMYINSKHGKIYEMEGDTGRAPTCVTCHGDHNVITAWGFLGMRGEEPDPEWEKDREKIYNALYVMGPARAPEVMRSTYDEWSDLREEMVDRCSACHAESFVRRDLEKGDELLREADRVKAQIIDVVNMLYEEGSIDDRTRFELYRESTAHRFATFQGGFHNSPLYSWDKGYLPLTADMVNLSNKTKETMANATEKAVEEDAEEDESLQSFFIIGSLGILGVGLIGGGVYWWRRKEKKE